MSLEGACTISKHVDACQRHLIVLYTRNCSLAVAAASETEQQAWYIQRPAGGARHCGG